jgi:hypothetical protein
MDAALRDRLVVEASIDQCEAGLVEMILLDSDYFLDLLDRLDRAEETGTFRPQDPTEMPLLFSLAMHTLNRALVVATDRMGDGEGVSP